MQVSGERMEDGDKVFGQADPLIAAGEAHYSALATALDLLAG